MLIVWYKPVIPVNAIPLYNFQFYLTGVHRFVWLGRISSISTGVTWPCVQASKNMYVPSKLYAVNNHVLKM